MRNSTLSTNQPLTHGQRRRLRARAGKISGQPVGHGSADGENVHAITDVFAIKLDPTTTPEGTNGKIIIVTKNSGLAYRKVVTTDFVKLVSGNSEVVISHKPMAKARVNIIVGDDIDLQNSNQIVWALSTRLRADKDVAFGDNRKIVFDTTRPTEKLKVPSLPQDIIKRISMPFFVTSGRASMKRFLLRLSPLLTGKPLRRRIRKSKGNSRNGCSGKA